MPGDGMAKGMNEIADSGVPVVQFNMLSKAMKGTYVGEKSVQSGRILGKMVVDKLGGASAKGKVVIGNCFPGFPVLENRAKGVEESLKAAPGLTALGPFDVKVSAVDNYNHWEQLYAANPDAVAMIGLCAPDIASLGKLNAAHGDKFVAGGYDLTARKPRGDQGRPRLCLAGTEPVRPGLSAGGAAGRGDQGQEAGRRPASMTPARRSSPPTASTWATGLPKVTFDELEKLAADPKATADFYKPWTKSVWPAPTPPGMQPVAAESQ